LFIRGQAAVAFFSTPHLYFCFRLCSAVVLLRAAFRPAARLDALNDPSFADGSFQTVVNTLQAGRSYKSLERWGMVEENQAMIF